LDGLVGRGGKQGKERRRGSKVWRSFEPVNVGDEGL